MDFKYRQREGYLINNPDKMFDFNERGVMGIHFCNEKAVKSDEAKMKQPYGNVLRKARITIGILD